MCVEKESDDEGTNRVPTHLGSLSKTIVQRKCCDRPQAKQGENLPHHLMFQKKKERGEEKREKNVNPSQRKKKRRKNAREKGDEEKKNRNNTPSAKRMGKNR